MGNARSRLRMNGPRIVNMNPHNKGLGFPLNPLPIIKRQLRKRQASGSMSVRKMMGCDTETFGCREGSLGNLRLRLFHGCTIFPPSSQ